MYFVIIGVTAIAIVSTYSFYTSKNALLSRTFDQLTSVRVVKKNQIEQFFNDRISELSLFTHLADINNFSGEGWISLKKAPNSIRFLFEHMRDGGYYEKIFIKIKNGRTAFYNFHSPDSLRFAILHLHPEDPVSKIYTETKFSNQYYIHDYSIDPQDKKSRMFISGPLDDSTNAIGKVVIEISLEAINSIMLEQNPNDGLGLSGESYLVGPDKLMRSTSRFQENSIMNTRVSTDGVESAFNNITGTSVIDDYRGIKVLAHTVKLNVPGLEWVILAEIDYREATKSIYSIRNNILIITILVAFIVFIISFIFSKRITLPLIKLTDATANIKSGNLDVTLPDVTNDEIGLLTNSFNGMATSLREKDAQLMDERNKRITAMIDGQELERQRLSRELHDGLGQSLIALKLKLETIKGKDVCAINKTIKDVKTSFDRSINEIRRISNDLMPAVLNEFGLVTALKNICEEISENTNIDLNCIYEGKFNDLDNRISIYLFRVMQEALNNIVKHAEASVAEVFLSRKEKNIILKISDNGKGWNISQLLKPTGNGIPNMRERIRLLNGKFDIQSQAGKGTQIDIEIPVKTKANG
ncbi:MAG: histidine kinase [Bacteroidales bacterium]